MLEQLEDALHYQKYYEARVSEAVSYVRHALGKTKPRFGLVLGTGLDKLAAEIEKPKTIDYAEIPNFPQTTVDGHEGKLIIGKISGVPVIGLKGRKHYYEVADAPFNTGILQVVFPVHVLAGLKVPHYFATNAAGGLNQHYQVGDIMVLKSHINLIPVPLLGRHQKFSTIDGEKTWRFQPMNSAYDPKLSQMLLRANSSFANKIHVHEGTYLAVTGPNYETESECIAFRDGLKVDAVGMSTTPEVIVARNRGMKCVAMSCITNKIAQDGTNATNHEEVKQTLNSEKVRNRLANIVRNFFKEYAKSY